jgi:transposase
MRVTAAVDCRRCRAHLHGQVSPVELIPGGAKKHLSAAQAKALLGKIRPRDLAGKTRRRVAAELIADLERIYERTKAADKTSMEAMRCLKRRLSDVVFDNYSPTRTGAASTGGNDPSLT